MIGEKDSSTKQLQGRVHAVMIKVGGCRPILPLGKIWKLFKMNIKFKGPETQLHHRDGTNVD